MEHERCDCAGNNWNHWNGSRRLKGKFGSRWQENIQCIEYKRQLYWEHVTWYGKLCGVKRDVERWGSALVQEENYREGKDCDGRKRNSNNNNNNNNNSWSK